jgi:hypothetical protein
MGDSERDSRGRLVTFAVSAPWAVRDRRRLKNQMAKEGNTHGPVERQDFMSAFAQEFAQECANVLLARLPKPNVVQPRYLTVEQAAVYISHTKKSFEYLMSKKMFPVIRRDRLVLIDKNDLDSFMARQKV